MPEKFVVPQFIDAEDKILGPITVRQFLICLGAAFAIFLEYKILAFAYFIVGVIFTGGLAAVFAFLKINGQPFHIFFVNFLETTFRPSLRTWQKGLDDSEIQDIVKRGKPSAPMAAKENLAPHPSSTRLRDLALTVNTGGVYNPDEDV